jgi:hypothetical protein
VRQPRLIKIGSALLVVPALIFASLLFATLRRGGISNRTASSNATLIASLAKTADQPWDWQELQRRYAGGSLDNAGAAKAIDQLIVFLSSKSNPANNGPLPWAEPFINVVKAGGAISPQQHQRLATAYYGSTPNISANPRVTAGKPLHFRMNYGGHWDLPGDDMVYAIRAVTLEDGRVLTAVSERDNVARRGQGSPDADLLSDDGTWSIEGDVITKDLPPGQHTLTFVVDVGVVGKGTLRNVGSGNRPGQATNWPAGGLRWSVNAPLAVTIVGPGEPAIPMVSDPALDPSGSPKFTAKAVRSQGRRAGSRVEVELVSQGQPPVPISADLVLRVAGREYPAGSMVISRDGMRATGMAADIGTLPPDVTTLDVLLRPNAAHAEESSGIDRIWGKTVELTGIPLKRLDVAPAPPPIE